MLVFDEFSTVSLLDAHGRIDPVRYPNFAALARNATWFPYATASSDDTGRALRSLFTGRTLWRFAKPSYTDVPRDLFTMLGRRYRMNVSEESSNLCPPRLCPGSRPKTAHDVLHALATGWPERFERWLRSVHPGSRPTLYLKHVLLPHAPWTYLPSGRDYPKGPSERGLSWDLWHYNRWLVNQDHQRHLLQVEFTDRLLGRALARLRETGLYDRSLIVLTADNGESFGRLGNGHNFNHRNAAEIALTPLIVKLPFQRAGRIDRGHVRVIDVLPTIASVAHVRPGWKEDGVPLLGPHRRRPPASTLLFERDVRPRPASPRGRRAAQTTAVRRGRRRSRPVRDRPPPVNARHRGRALADASRERHSGGARPTRALPRDPARRHLGAGQGQRTAGRSR
jgi:Sulfatase